ncbi:hypothetical protein MMC28_006504 [Mycoblastus sanguinarius]|nr:hypothetical protein [Mycoblastus sanguinarius]
MGLGGESGGRRGGLGVWFETRGEDSTKGTETDFIITSPTSQSIATPPDGSLSPHISKLLYATTTDTLRDIIQEEKGLPIRHGLVRKHGRIKMLTTHRDAHVYLFPYWILDMIKRNEKFDSISEDVLGWWAKAGWQDGLAEKLHFREIFDTAFSSEGRDGENGGQDTWKIEDDIDLASMSSTHTSTLRPQTSKTTSDSPKTSLNKKSLSVPPMLAYIHPANSSFIRRVDTSSLLLSTSVRLAGLPPLTNPQPSTIPTPLSHNQKISTDPSLIAPHTNIHAPSTLIAPNTTIATHAVIKSSVVGANCAIEAGVRLTGCLLMDGCIVEEKASLQGCILGRRCVVGKGASLKDCEVQEGYKVEEGVEGKGEKYMVFEGLEEVGEEGEVGEGMVMEEEE